MRTFVAYSKNHFSWFLSVTWKQLNIHRLQRHEHRLSSNIISQKLDYANVRQCKKMRLPYVILLKPCSLDPKLKKFSYHQKLKLVNIHCAYEAWIVYLWVLAWNLPRLGVLRWQKESIAWVKILVYLCKSSHRWKLKVLKAAFTIEAEWVCKVKLDIIGVVKDISHQKPDAFCFYDYVWGT